MATRVLRTIAWLGVALVVGACTRSPAPRRSGPSSASSELRLRVASAPFELSSPIQREVAVSAGGDIYLAGGLDSANQSVNGVFSLNPQSGLVRQLGSVPDPFHDAAGALMGHRLMVFGGGSVVTTDLVQTFDLRTHSSEVIGHLPRPVSDLAAASIGRTVYLVGGYDGTAPLDTIYATQDGVHFSLVAKLPTGLRYAGVAAVHGRIVIAGGTGSQGAVSTVYLLDPSQGRVSLIGHLAKPVTEAATASLAGRVYVIGGRDRRGRPVAGISEIDPDAGTIHTDRPLSRPVADAGVASSGSAAWLIGGLRSSALSQVLDARLVPIGSAAVPSASSSSSAATTRPFAGLLLIADRGNNRLLVVNPSGAVVWQYPRPGFPSPALPFYFPDDAFWVDQGHAILVNEEDNDLLVEISYPAGRILWRYGHPGIAGSSAGFLHQPDDLYPLPGGGLVVADALNCRILFFSPAGTPARQIGTTGSCVHGLPRTVGYPNGDTPVRGGDLLITELNGGYVDEVTRAGNPVWSLKVPGVPVPSDPQQLSDGSYLVVDYQTPGRIVRFTSSGRVLWSFGPSSGSGELRHPSIAAQLPNGLVAATDDYGNRVVLIDPRTGRIVWRYGQGSPGSGPDQLRIPDGLDLLLPNGDTPLHFDLAPGTLSKP